MADLVADVVAGLVAGLLGREPAVTSPGGI